MRLIWQNIFFRSDQGPKRVFGLSRRTHNIRKANNFRPVRFNPGPVRDFGLFRQAPCKIFIRKNIFLQSNPGLNRKFALFENTPLPASLVKFIRQKILVRSDRARPLWKRLKKADGSETMSSPGESGGLEGSTSSTSGPITLTPRRGRPRFNARSLTPPPGRDLLRVFTPRRNTNSNWRVWITFEIQHDDMVYPNSYLIRDIPQENNEVFKWTSR